MTKFMSKQSIIDLLKKSKLSKPISVNEVAEKVMYLASDKSKKLMEKLFTNMEIKIGK